MRLAHCGLGFSIVFNTRACFLLPRLLWLFPPSSPSRSLITRCCISLQSLSIDVFPDSILSYLFLFYCILRKPHIHLSSQWQKYRIFSTLFSSWDFLLFFFFFATLCLCGILVPRPGFKTTPSILEAWSLNHWTSREVLKSVFWMLDQYFQYLCRIPHECSRIIPILKLTS